jgi:hypothetical protein
MEFAHFVESVTALLFLLRWRGYGAASSEVEFGEAAARAY